MAAKKDVTVELNDSNPLPSVEAAINFDQPLHPETALVRDNLSRRAFAEAAARSFKRLSSSGSLVVSVEGAWGSGKSSALAMIEALLRSDPEAEGCVIVHFNPWLIGDRDSLLRHFLARISEAVKLADHGQEGRRVAKELKAYAKIFDVLKLIPGAEPWASMIKSVVESVGDATGSVADYKTPDLEQQKNRVEKALRDFKRPIVVFIDDVDRLFPLEVFEMIRIIKAVGGLPNVGYVVAWDSRYISCQRRLNFDPPWTENAEVKLTHPRPYY
jgi:Predicted P-loop ATPase